jgi:MFS family permease
MQPFLLKLYGHPKAYGVAGLAAAIIAGAQIIGGLAVPYVGKLFRKRTTVLATGAIISFLALLSTGLSGNFYTVIALLVVWALTGAAVMPVRQAYLNGLITGNQRATVLSFDQLVGSGGAVIIQPVLGKVADVSGYPLSYIGSAVFQVMALPFIILARRQKPVSDPILPSDIKSA